MKWSELLDGIVDAAVPPAMHVKALHLPAIQGWQEGQVRVTFAIPEEVIQPHGSTFGGYLAAVADEMAGMATMTVLPDGASFTTSDLRMQYFRPIACENLSVEATVINQSRSNIHVEAVFSNASGKLIAKAFAVQRLTPGAN